VGRHTGPTCELRRTAAWYRGSWDTGRRRRRLRDKASRIVGMSARPIPKAAGHTFRTTAADPRERCSPHHSTCSAADRANRQPRRHRPAAKLASGPARQLVWKVGHSRR
jgi:hypothetical protein